MVFVGRRHSSGCIWGELIKGLSLDVEPVTKGPNRKGVGECVPERPEKEEGVRDDVWNSDVERDNLGRDRRNELAAMRLTASRLRKRS